MKKVLFALLLAMSAMMNIATVYADDLPEIAPDDSTEQLPPLVDPADMVPN